MIDMLRDFINKSGALYVGRAGETIIPFINEMIREYRKNNAPVIFICDNHEEDDKEFEMFNTHCVAGSPGSEIIKEIDVEEGDKIIKKRRYSAFCGTDLDIFLREKLINEISIVGVCTNICVLYTASDARNFGYKVNIYRDGVASFDDYANDFALKEAKKTLGCTIL